jgi:hypothetical protein
LGKVTDVREELEVKAFYPKPFFVLPELELVPSG